MYTKVACYPSPDGTRNINLDRRLPPKEPELTIKRDISHQHQHQGGSCVVCWLDRRQERHECVRPRVFKHQSTSLPFGGWNILGERTTSATKGRPRGFCNTHQQAWPEIPKLGRDVRRPILPPSTPHWTVCGCTLGKEETGRSPPLL